MNDTEKQVSNLVNFFEQKRNENRINAQMAQHRVSHPGSAGRLLSLDDTFDGNALAQMQHMAQHYQPNRIPATPHKQARYGIPITPQSIRRSGAPQTLSIPNQNAIPIQHSVYAPTASLNNSPTFADFPHIPTSADRASFPDINSPVLHALVPVTPSHRGHARNNSTISIASSIGSASTLLFPDSGMQFSDRAMGYAPHFGTPPVSPKKRKSPTKSPTKGKDKPNFLDKAIMRNTGVTHEQINMYIGDPTSADPKNWRCLWDGCTHLAARKENIRAHVQTHLGDRPYECPECHADFVRSHDFTRHYTTHVDSRDFKCPDCPQAFNRADALQRHRDRDFCNGPPPGSPTKVRRAMEAVDKKKDPAGRRSKKQAARKRTTKRQESAELSDEFWSSSGGSPEYFPSDAGSPEMILDGLVDNMPDTSSQQTYVPMGQTSFSANELKHGEEALERIFAALSEENSSPRQTMSLSPPMSPRQSQQTLTPFSPTPKRRSQQKHEMTPPASRDSMLEFFSAPSIHGNQTVSSAPSLPDLSSTSTSPLAFEPVTDFEEFCNSMNTTSGESWLDPRFGKGQTETFDFGELMDSKASNPAWLDSTDDLFGPV